MKHSFLFDKQTNVLPKKALPTEAKPHAKAERNVAEILYLFDTYGDADYDGEPVSQASHMIQCAMLSMEALSDLPVTIGALLHDVGHLLKHEQITEAMGMYGVVNHEGVGAEYLRQKGFSERVCAIVEHHVDAKRYLVATDASYKQKLSPASLHTLDWQGGEMTADEAAAFEHHPYFTDILQVRRWDEEAKNTNTHLLSITSFRTILHDHLWQTAQC